MSLVGRIRLFVGAGACSAGPRYRCTKPLARVFIGAVLLRNAKMAGPIGGVIFPLDESYAPHIA